MRGNKEQVFNKMITEVESLVVPDGITDNLG